MSDALSAARDALGQRCVPASLDAVAAAIRSTGTSTTSDPQERAVLQLGEAIALVQQDRHADVLGLLDTGRPGAVLRFPSARATESCLRTLSHYGAGAFARAIRDADEGVVLFEPHVVRPDELCLLVEMEMYYGLAHRRLGLREVAIESYFRALARLKDLETPDAWVLTAMLHNNVAIILRHEGQEEASLRHLELALRTSERVASAHLSHVRHRLNYARGLDRLGRREEARRVLEEAQAIADRSTREVLKMEVAGAKARHSLELGQPEEAALLLGPVVAFCRERSRPNDLIRALETLGRAYILLEDDRADQVLREAHATAKELGDLELCEKTSGALSRHHANRASWEEAYTWAKCCREAERRRFDEQRSVQIQELRARYDLAERAHEAELLRLRTVDLERAVAERTHDLEERNRELEEARDAAETAARVRGQFLAVTGHELRTPLNAILGYTQMLEDDVASGALDAVELASGLSRINTSASHLLELIERVLELSSLQGGGEVAKRRAFRVDDVIRSVTAEQTRSVDTGDATLALHLDLPHEPMLSDASRLGRVFAHVLGNAFEHSTGDTILVNARRDADDLLLEVTNATTLRDPAVIDALFAPFTQGDMSTTREHGGLGLGLTLARLQCQVLRGSLDGVLDDRGLTVRIRVPWSL